VLLERDFHASLLQSIIELFDQKYMWVQIENDDRWKEILRNTILTHTIELRAILICF
jgi:hypothetical protein